MPATLLDAFNAAARFGTQLADNQDGLLRQKAETDLINMQLNLDSSTNGFLQKLQSRNDYENFGSEADNFLEQQRSLLQSQSPNAYTAKAADQMVAQYRNTLMQKVSAAAKQGQTQDILIKDQQNMQLIGNLYSGQDKVDKQNYIKDREYVSGLIDRDRYTSDVLTNASGAVYDEYAKTATDKMKSVIESGGTLDDVFNAVDAVEPVVTCRMLDSGSASSDTFESGNARYTDASNLIDRKAIKDKVKQTAAVQWNTEIKDMQQQNANNLSEIYSSALTASKAQQPALVRQGQSMLMQLRGSRLSEDDRNKYAKYFADMLDALKKGEKPTKAWKDELSNDMGRFIELGANGMNSGKPGIETMYMARDAFMQYAQEQYAAYGLDETQAELDFASKFMGTAMDIVGKTNPKVKSALAQLKDYSVYLEKKMAKGPSKETLYQDLCAHAWDDLMDTDLSNVNVDDFVSSEKKWMDTQTMRELAIQQADKEGKSEFGRKNSIPLITRLTGLGKESEGANLARGMYELQNNDLAYTDTSGQQHVDPGAEAAVREKIIPMGMSALDASGVDTENIQPNTVKPVKGKHDIDLMPTYRDVKTGDLYEIRATDKKHYQIMKNGSVWKTDSDIAPAEKQQRTDARDKAQKERSAIKAEEKKLKLSAQEQQQVITDELNRASYSEDVPADINADAWAVMPVEDRRVQLESLRKTNRKAYDEYVKRTTGVTF